MQAGDYIISNETIGEVVVNAVGLLKGISGDTATVLFVGINKQVDIDISYIEVIAIRKTGKTFETKICNICHIVKEMKDFDRNQTDAKGRFTTRPSCKSCRVGIDGAAMLPSEKKRMDKSRPEGIFICPICHKTSIAWVTANLVRDHDHVTGMAREWICDSCNTGLGRFKDDIKLLKELVEYLEKHADTKEELKTLKKIEKKVDKEL